MRSPRAAVIVAGAVVALAVAAPSHAQGKSGGKAPGKGPTRPPSNGAISSQPTSTGSPATTTTPFAWLDDASVMEPGHVSVAVSMARWQGSGLSQTSLPIVDTGFGLAQRAQVSVSVPRVAGGLGTTFFSSKVAVFTDDERAVAVAVGPTLALENGATAPGRGRLEWGLPLSAQLDRWNSRIYYSTGYFSPGIWYVGAGIGKPLSDRIGVSMSFSHAWATLPEPSPGVAAAAGPTRNELSAGASYDLTRTIGVFGSISRTPGVAELEGAGTTIGFGMSWSAAVTTLRK